MFRRPARHVAAPLIAALIVASIPGEALAQSANVTHTSRTTSAVKRTVWTIAGAVAGFGLGAWFGLHKFDDATNSDRKVTISAVTGAVLGGIAGATLSGDVKPALWRARRPRVDAPVPVPCLVLGADDALVSRIRQANAREFEHR